MKNKIILVTGMSGAGKTTALKTLEDIGFEAVDNIPLSILPLLLNNKSKVDQSLAIGIDVRNRDFDTSSLVGDIIPLLKDKGYDSKIVFFDCNDEVLLRRFKETRRKHPISEDKPVADSIEKEREILSPILDYSDIVLDTSDLSVPELKKWIKSNLSTDKAPPFYINITSFSFKKGLPRDADLVFDVRFLKNPHYNEALKKLTGKDKKIKKYILSDRSFKPLFRKLSGLFVKLLPSYMDEGKSYLTIGIGCTGGRHRSVAVSELLLEFLKKKGYKNISLSHRDLAG